MELLALSGARVDGSVLAAALAAIGVGALVFLRRHPRLSLVTWLAVICLVPVWVTVHLKVDWEPEVVITLVLLVTVVPPIVRRRPEAVGGITPGDVLILLFLVAALVPIAFGAARLTDVFVLLAQWVAALLAGRLVGRRISLQWIYGTIAVGFTVVAVLALIEFLTSWNPFVHIPGHGPLYDAWSPIQIRGGQPRAEGAFGHSIALGASLALAVPFTLAAPFRMRRRVVMLVLVLAASAITFSRVGLVTAVLGVVLTVGLPRTGLSSRARWAVIGGLVLSAAALAPSVSTVFAAAGDEATGSADYRVALLNLVRSMAPFGISSSAHELPTGARFFGSFKSIDDALLLAGLTYGWVPLVLVVALLLGAIWCLLSGRATPPSVAVVAQIPALVSVAAITQYATLIWFVAGLALFTQSLRSRPSSDGSGVAGAGAVAGAGVGELSSGARILTPAGHPEW